MSTSSAKMVTGWHVLKIEGYPRTKGLPGRRSIQSSTFIVGGHSWYIGYFPGGMGSLGLGNTDYVSVQLNLHHPAASAEVFTQFKFSLLDHAGESVYSGTNSIFTFSSKTISHGISGFIKKTELESLYVKDDSFKIRCDVTVIKDIHGEDDPVALLDSQVGGDVTFEVGGNIFTAHRSSVFMAQLFGPMKEKTANHVRIDDMDARVFKAMLRFMYTDMLPDMEEDEKTVMSQHLLVAADRYNMERLKLICEDMLRKRINTDIVATTLVLAEQHGCCGLKDVCFKFLISPGNLKTVMANDSFQYLKNSCPSLLDELLANVAP
ncbi:hypothetical protein SORBI_3005G190500 [Sorghum bicolor]|uniref:BTB domain-containing protein n=1 Tax=Sorghum bicolor TaxID=4558 RepID=A0A1Z5RJL8_SORBI|nr:hypothetical protein SORBI_3005G190500 [Sorghum bicolor]